MAGRPAIVHLDLHSLPGPENITRRVLDNGLTVLARENFASPAVVVDADLRVGALYEPPEKAGLTNFTAMALMRGTTQRSFEQIYEQIESAGASLSFSGGTHISGFGGKALAEDLPLLLETAAEALRQPIFPEALVDRLRGELLTRLALRADDTGSRADQAFHELAYPDHPYARETDGYPETVRAITRQDLADFHRRCFGPRGMIVTIVGAVPAAQAVDMVERSFGDWRNPDQPAEPALPPVGRPQGEVSRRVAMPGKAQSDLLLGWPGPARSHPHFLAARLANNILGVFGFMGRLGRVVREKHGMAYTAASGLDGGLGPGPWRAYAGVNPRNVERALDLVRGEIRKFIARPVSRQEFEDSRSQFLGRLPLNLETNEGVAGAIASLELYGLGLDFLQRYPALLHSLTRADLLDVAREFMSAEDYVLAVAGPE